MIIFIITYQIILKKKLPKTGAKIRKYNLKDKCSLLKKNFINLRNVDFENYLEKTESQKSLITRDVFHHGTENLEDLILNLKNLIEQGNMMLLALKNESETINQELLIIYKKMLILSRLPFDGQLIELPEEIVEHGSSKISDQILNFANMVALKSGFKALSSGTQLSLTAHKDNIPPFINITYKKDFIFDIKTFEAITGFTDDMVDIDKTPIFEISEKHAELIKLAIIRANDKLSTCSKVEKKLPWAAGIFMSIINGGFFARASKFVIGKTLSDFFISSYGGEIKNDLKSHYCDKIKLFASFAMKEIEARAEAPSEYAQGIIYFNDLLKETLNDDSLSNHFKDTIRDILIDNNSRMSLFMMNHFCNNHEQKEPLLGFRKNTSKTKLPTIKNENIEEKSKIVRMRKRF